MPPRSPGDDWWSSRDRARCRGHRAAAPRRFRSAKRARVRDSRTPDRRGRSDSVWYLRKKNFSPAVYGRPGTGGGGSRSSVGSPAALNQSSRICASSLFGRGDTSRTLNVVGRLTALPKISACCFGSDGSRFITLSEMNGVIWRMCTRSSGFWIRCTMKFEHYESTVFESSLGRCDATIRNAPYFRPSFATRSKIRLASMAWWDGRSAT